MEDYNSQKYKKYDSVKKAINSINNQIASSRYCSVGTLNAYQNYNIDFEQSKEYINNNYNKTNYEEDIELFIDDNKTISCKMIIHNYECEIKFNKDIQAELLDSLHFANKYFQFPIFYFFKGQFNDDSRINTITLKDYRSFKIKSENEQLLKKLKDSANNDKELINYANLYKVMQDHKRVLYQINGWHLYDPKTEYERQGVLFSDSQFCLSDKNKDYLLCDTYPNLVVIPTVFNNEEITKVASSRMKNRFPVLTYFYNTNKIRSSINKVSNGNKGVKSYLYRSAQIKTGGIIFKSKNLEIEYLNKIMNMENDDKGFIIFDCRPLLNAKANTFKGAGVEEIKKYKNCHDLIFGCIENIHSVRQSLKKALLKAYYGKETIVKGKISFNIRKSNMKNFLSKFEDTKWLEYISDLLMGSITVTNNLLKGKNVLVHCSDGWDRTAQICSLAQIIIDPFFRTIKGFAILIEKDWVSFGHQFATRNGCDFRKEKKGERSPVFVQFIHCVHQMTLQYPTAFEFNDNFLLFLCTEIYSNKYGTFLFNSEKDLNANKAKQTTISIWSDIFREKIKYINDLYKEIKGPIDIKGELQYLSIWNDYFFQYDKVGKVEENNTFLDKGVYVAKILDEKKSSILELLQVIKENNLLCEIVNNKFYNLYKHELGLLGK
jgi:hypothetical protein